MIKVIKEITKKEFKDFLYDINLEDNNLYEELNNDRALNVFQFSGNTAEGLTKRIKPKNFTEMCVVNAAARPGTIDFVDDYINSRDKKENKYPQAVQEVLKETSGVCFYQEQVMSVFNVIGGFTLEETNEVRGLMKKLGKAEKKKSDLDRWDEVVKKFEEGAVKQGIKKEEAEVIADDLLKLSAYSFNKSHAVAYSYIAIMNLYLSFYFKSYYFSSILSYEAGREDTLKEALNKCKFQNFAILPPDINKSDLHFTPEIDRIRFGLNEIKFVGEIPATRIIALRPYDTFFDFMVKTQGSKINRNVIAALICAGAFDELLNKERTKGLFLLEQYLEKRKKNRIIEKLYAVWQSIEQEAERIPGLETTGAALAQYEEKYFGFNFFHTLFTDKTIQFINVANKRGLCGRYYDDLNTFQSSMPIPVIIDKMRVFNDKNGKEMAFVECQDMFGKSISIPLFQSFWKLVKEKVIPKNIYLMNLFINEEGNIMFGAKKYTTDEEKKRMIRKIT